MLDKSEVKVPMLINHGQSMNMEISEDGNNLITY